MAYLVNKILIGASPDTVQIDEEHGIGGLKIEYDRARQPKKRYLGNGDLLLLFGPGRDRRKVTITGTAWPGFWPPDLSGLGLPATVPLVIAWPHGESTALSVLTAGVEQLSSDQIKGPVSWRLEGVGPVTAGIDPVS